MRSADAFDLGGFKLGDRYAGDPRTFSSSTGMSSARRSLRVVFLGAVDENLARARLEKTGLVRDWKRLAREEGGQERTCSSEDGRHDVVGDKMDSDLFRLPAKK